MAIAATSGAGASGPGQTPAAEDVDNPGRAAPESPSANPVVRVSNLRKVYRAPDGDSVRAVDDITLSLSKGEFMVLLGPSGCGKTTLLRCIAGLETPQAGRIEVGGRTVFSSAERVNLPSYKRNLSMVFQSYALWPHMTVFDNIAYPLRATFRGRPPKAEVRARVEKLMEIVGIPHLAKRYPSQISGGQQQRVALCRALVADSDVVLFDEPLSNVDARVRERLRLQLLLLQRELGFAALFVTHDRQEALVLAHSIAVLEAGKVAQLGAPRDVYTAPVSRYVAEFMGPTNRLDGTLRPGSGPVRTLDTEAGPVSGVLASSAAEAEPGRELVAIWRPEASVIGTQPGEYENQWQVVVQESVFSGSYMEHIFRVGKTNLRSLTTEMEPIAHGSSVWLSAPAARVSLIEK
jgi:iron(III) transport system ATP-binding protein